MNIDRRWLTPITAGAFLLSAVTGVLIFFHLDIGLNKLAHEWLSWLLVGAVVLHVTLNFGALRRHLSSRLGAGLLGLCMLVLALSFLSLGEKQEPPFMASIHALADTPITTLAQVARREPEDVREILRGEGLHPESDAQTLGELAGPNPHRQMLLLNKLLGQH
ncbi:DUF4405 domain-containing protein [Rhodocyclus tenuis]|nr:DUF4405 domain-containing protein [Rhodocyclus gracilis]NJA88388.1 DUF4405 domain-containing protein [Rhodocyclus gracilis]